MIHHSDQLHDINKLVKIKNAGSPNFNFELRFVIKVVSYAGLTYKIYLDVSYNIAWKIEQELLKLDSADKWVIYAIFEMSPLTKFSKSRDHLYTL